MTHRTKPLPTHTRTVHTGGCTLHATHSLAPTLPSRLRASSSRGGAPRVSAPVVRVLAEEGALARAARALEVVEVDPQVGGVLDARLDRHRLVVRLWLAREQVRVEHRWPQHRPAELRRHRDAEVGEAGPAARLDVREVDEEGVDAHALRRPVRRLLVVVRTVELARLVLEDLKVLRIFLGHAGDPSHALCDCVDGRVPGAPVLVAAPVLRRRSDRGELVPGERPLQLLPGELDHPLRLGGRDEAFELDDVRLRRE
mmetsp:Transcript_42850/g.135342  ORF Transcript_42850/g.135342 Transcript_42850/m.135342 type:complete len:256 (+) Transcript_42850:56-823(+)